MTNLAALQFAARRARLSQVAPGWADKIQNGDPTIGWPGDRALVLYHNKVEDKMEIWHELPDRKPVLVMKVTAETFDINRACAALRDASHDRQSVDDIIARVDKHNEGVEMARAKELAAQREALKERAEWAISVDTGRHVRPMTVTRSVR